MTTTTSEYHDAYLSLRESSSDSVDDVYSGSFDFCFGSSGWDKRAVAIAQSSSFHSKFGLLFQFKHRDNNGLSLNHDKVLASFYTANCDKLNVQKVDATDLDPCWKIVVDSLKNCFNELKKPLDVFVDLSTTPRYFSMGLMAAGIEAGIIRSITYGYAEGLYSESENEKNNEIFTEGGWQPVSIPHLDGDWEPHKQRHFILSLIHI